MIDLKNIDTKEIEYRLNQDPILAILSVSLNEVNQCVSAHKDAIEEVCAVLENYRTHIELQQKQIEDQQNVLERMSVAITLMSKELAVLNGLDPRSLGYNH